MQEEEWDIVQHQTKMIELELQLVLQQYKVKELKARAQTLNARAKLEENKEQVIQRRLNEVKEKIKNQD